MVGSEYGAKDYKSPKISIGAIMKNPEMLKFVSDYHKTKTMCKLAGLELRKKYCEKIRYYVLCCV